MDTFQQKLDKPFKDTFQQKLVAGLQGEEIARVYLESLGHKVEDNLTPTTIYNLRTKDLIVNGSPVEVKLDILSAKTGNIVIEHQSLKTHTAPFYIYVLPTFYKATKSGLEYLTEVFPDKVQMGDDGRTGTRVPIKSSFFEEVFTRL